jgi:hypothetical protein
MPIEENVHLTSAFSQPNSLEPSREEVRNVRLAAFAVTVAAITLGHIRQASCPECPMPDRGLVANGLFYGLLVADLLPATIYVLGTRRWKTVLGWGAGLVIFGALPWVLALVHESFLLVSLIAYPVLLVGCIVAAISDARARERGGTW